MDPFPPPSGTRAQPATGPGGRERAPYTPPAARGMSAARAQPRDLHLSPARIRRLADMNAQDLVSRIETVLDSELRAARWREARVRLAAARKAQTAHTEIARQGGKTAHLAQTSAQLAQTLRRGHASRDGVRTITEISLALSRRAEREKVSRGFVPGHGTIARAARVQGRSWLEVRDDLVRHGLLARTDPRARLKASLARGQKGGPFRAGRAMNAERLEQAAMQRLRRNRHDPQALSWLGLVSASQDTRKTRDGRVLPHTHRTDRAR